MPLLAPETEITIGRVRLSCPSSDFLSEQHLVERLLGAADLRPRALPPSAILCVRRWHGRLHSRPDGLTEDLARFARQAVRPALGPVPAHAEAVVFLDEAEMLACATLDWLAGVLRTNWWWFALFRGRSPTEFLSKQWSESPELAPAALEILACHRQAGAFVERLAETLTREILDNMLRCHRIALPSSGETVAAPRTQSRAPVLPQPWLPWVTEVPSRNAVSIAAQALLGCGLLLRRSPSTARSHAFQEELSAWLGEHLAADRSPGSFAEAKASAPTSVRWESQAVTGRTLQPEHSLASSLLSTTARCTQGYAESAAQAADAESSPTQEPTPVGSRHDAVSSAAHLSAYQEQESPLTAEDLRSADSDEGALAAGQAALTSMLLTEFSPLFETSFGGIFFLLNLAIALGYYPDFSAPADHSLELNIWDFLALMGLEFCDAGQFRQNRLWTALAQLAGRAEEEAPGEYFNPGESRQEWVGRTAAEIRDRLGRAFNRDDGPEFLCRLPARVALTHVRVDVHFSLNDHPIEIRMAGLDRDLGWIPAAGRYVAYHFE
jgi:hypothetical protein